MLLYIYSAFIAINKKMRSHAKKIFIKSKKFIAFVNAGMVLTSVISNDDNSVNYVAKSSSDKVDCGAIVKKLAMSSSGKL